MSPYARILLFLSFAVVGSCSRPDVRFPQFVQDQVTVDGLISGVGEIYQQSLAGQPAGEQDVSAGCPHGGTAHVTGTVTANSAELDFELQDCRLEEVADNGESASSFEVTGTIAYAATNSASPFRIDEDYLARGLAVSGTLNDSGEEASINESCGFSAAIRYDEGSGTIAARFCDRHVSAVFYHEACSN